MGGEFLNTTIEEIKNIVESIPGYTVVYKIHGELERICYSKNILELMGYTEAEYQQTTAFDIVASGDREGIQQKVAKAASAHENMDMVYRLVHKNGRLLWVRSHANYICDMDGYPVYLTSIFNVTDEWEDKNIILDSSDRGIVVFDKDTKAVLYGNSNFFKYAGKSEKECLGSACYDVVCGAGCWDEKNCICFKALGRKEPLISENPISGSCYSIRASQTQWGEHSAIIFYLSDITEARRKDAEIKKQNEILASMQEDAIRSYRQQLDAIIETSTEVLSTCRMNLTKDLCIAGTSKSSYIKKLQKQDRASGYFAESIKCIDPKEIEQMSCKPCVEDLLEAFDKGIKIISEDFHYKVDADKEAYIQTTINMARNPITHDVEAVLFNRDLTEKKLQMDIMERLMEKQCESISIINVKTRKVAVLQYTYDMFAGDTYQNADYSECTDFFTNTYVAPEDRERYRKCTSIENLKKQMEKQGTYSVAFHFQSKNHQNAFKTITYFYLDERKTVFLGITQDITEVTKREQQNLADLKAALLRADQATEAKSAFFSNISHDMRTPLNGILGFAHLGMEAATLEESLEYFKKIKSSGNFLLKLINDTLDISKAESGRMKLNPRKILAMETAQEIIDAVEEEAADKGIRLVVEYPKDSRRYVWADQLRLQQIFTNLLGNAIKFTPSGGEVDFIIELLKTPVYGCNHKITVKDTGVGMKAAFVPHAFEAYSQQDSVMAGKTMGTGLGLAIVKQLVDLMHGHIELQSEEGKGTQYDVYLPLEMMEGLPEEAIPQKEVIDFTGYQVMLCEDHPINQELACKLLERKGMKVQCAQNGRIAVELFEKSPVGTFDAILMDIRMPEMDGLEAAKAIRQLPNEDAKTVPIIAMTANAYESDRKEAFACGMNAYVTKPIIPDKLYHTLSEQLLKS